MRNLNITISEETWELFQLMAKKQDVTIPVAFENYFGLNLHVPVFRLSKKDQPIVPVLFNIQAEMEFIKEYLSKNAEKVLPKKDQYMLMWNVIESAQTMIETILHKLDTAVGKQFIKEKDKLTEEYIMLMQQVHSVISGKHEKMQRFCEILVKEFEDIKMIRIE